MKLDYLPNVLSVIRVALIVPVIWLLLHGRYGTTLIIFGLAGFTDGLDGFLAKRFGWRTELGAVLDPFADKLLMLCSYLTLAVLQLIPVWLFVVVVARDVMIVAGGLSYQYLIGPFKATPTAVSKLNTAFQILLVLAVVANAGFEIPPDLAVTILGAAVFVTTVVSGLDYVWTWGWRAWRNSDHGENVE